MSDRDAARHDDTLARLRGPHAVGKPCPRQPYMMVTTPDIERGRCGACGNVIGGLHRNWMPLIVHGGRTLSICLGCGKRRLA